MQVGAQSVGTRTRKYLYETAGHLNACRHRGMQCKKLQDDDETGGSGHDLGDRPVINLGLS